MASILREWVTYLPIRHQGVLITALRGCDNAPKENSAKNVLRALRYMVLNPADERELDFPSAFMLRELKAEHIVAFLKDWDHYPIHFVQHLMHAVEVIAYCHETPHHEPWYGFYHRICHKLHVNPETPMQMEERLTEDRIAKYNAANPPE